MFRFSGPATPPKRSRPQLALRVRFFLLASALLLVMLARNELRRPAVHAAIGRMFDGPVATPVVHEPSAVEKEEASSLEISLLDTIQDNTFFREAEQPAWFAMLAKLKKTDPEHLASSGVAISYAQLVSQPNAYRGRLVRVAGEVMRVEAVTPAKNDLGIDQLYRVTLKPADGGVWPLTLYTLQPPPETGEPSEPYSASASGFFFKNLSYRWEDGVGVTPIVLAQRLETVLLTNQATVASEASDSSTKERDFDLSSTDSLGRALLKELGVDETMFSSVVDRRPFIAEEREAFYAVLHAVGETPASQLVRLAQRGLPNYAARQQPDEMASEREKLTAAEVLRQAELRRYSVAPLFGDGSSQRGELFVFDAIVRRVVRVEVTNDAAQLDHYYELEAFPKDSQNLPLVFCMRELPAGFPIGEGIRQPARLAGFFFKQWVYRTRKPSDTKGDLRQYAPLLIGRAPVAFASPLADNQRPGSMIGIAGAVLVVATVVWLWRSAKADRHYEQSTLRRIRRETDHDFSNLP